MQRMIKQHMSFIMPLRNPFDATTSYTSQQRLQSLLLNLICISNVHLRCDEHHSNYFNPVLSEKLTKVLQPRLQWQHKQLSAARGRHVRLYLPAQATSTQRQHPRPKRYHNDSHRAPYDTQASWPQRTQRKPTT